ncbi:hypothetical protein GQ457_16G022270 [Hibiscus cannabinus]
MITPEKNPNADEIHVNIRIIDFIVATGTTKLWTSLTKSHPKLYPHCKWLLKCASHEHNFVAMGAWDLNIEKLMSRCDIGLSQAPQMESGSRHGRQGGSGSASNIIFQNIEMFNVPNPIIIDQNYCDQDCNTPFPVRRNESHIIGNFAKTVSKTKDDF